MSEIQGCLTPSASTASRWVSKRFTNAVSAESNPDLMRSKAAYVIEAEVSIDIAAGGLVRVGHDERC